MGSMPAPTQRISTILTLVPGDPVTLLAYMNTACTRHTDTQQANSHAHKTNRQIAVHIRPMIMRRGRGGDATWAAQHLPRVQEPLGLVLSSV